MTKKELSRLAALIGAVAAPAAPDAAVTTPGVDDEFDRAVTCKECGTRCRVPAAAVWVGIDKILCRSCGHDLRAQVIADVWPNPDDRPAWAYNPKEGN